MNISNVTINFFNEKTFTKTNSNAWYTNANGLRKLWVKNAIV